MRRFLLLIPFLFSAVLMLAQDKHFTQFYASPLTLNPALTGAFDGRYRVGGIYRDQWRGVLDDPYVTFSSSVDVRFDVTLDSRYKDAVAIGLVFLSDKVNGIDFITNQLALSAAFHKGLDFDKRQFITLGIQAALMQRNINYELLTFDDQFNQLNDFSLATQEVLPENNFAFSDFSVGLNYIFRPKKRTSINAGFTLNHFLQPQLSFYPPAETEEDINSDSKLYMKFGGQLSVQFPIASRISLIPRILFTKQGPHMAMTAGSNIRIALNDFNNNAFQIGTWVRPVRNDQEDFGLDAVILMVGFEISNVLFGLSYDANIADLKTHKQGQNAIEFSAMYQGSFDDESILCPKF